MLLIETERDADRFTAVSERRLPFLKSSDQGRSQSGSFETTTTDFESKKRSSVARCTSLCRMNEGVFAILLFHHTVYR